jgi:outer membrane protein OmpU
MRENQMQKVLLASTALAMSAGWAMADVTNGGDALGASITLEGFAEMGVQGDDIADNPFNPENDVDLEFHTDIDMTIVMLGVTDGGLEFGAEIDLDETDVDFLDPSGIVRDEDGDLRDFTLGGSSAFDPRRQGGEEIFIRGAFGALYMGDVDGAFDWAMSEAIIGSSLNDDHEHAGYSGNAGLDGLYDGQIARYEYSWGDFGVAISGEIDDTDQGDPVLGIGAKYSWVGYGADITVGGGVQTISGLEDTFSNIIEEDEEFSALIWGLSADVGMDNGIRGIVSYQQASLDGVEDDSDPIQWGVALGYEWDALLVAVNYGHYQDWAFLGERFDSEGYGLIANYDLGGGAELQAGYGHSTVNSNNFSTYSFGVAMNF